MTVEEQLSRAFAALDEAVGDHVAEHHPVAVGLIEPAGPRTRPRRTWRSPLTVAIAATSVAAVIAVVAGIALAGGDGRSAPPPAHHTVAPKPTDSPTQAGLGDTPSQSPAAAARDHILPAVAALPFERRVHQSNGSRVWTTKTMTPQGLWVLSTPTWPRSSGCFAKGASADRRYQFCDLSGELLLLSPDSQHILRAYPLPNEAHWIATGNGSIYLGESADGAQPTSMVCRLPLNTLALTCRIFQEPAGPGNDGPGWTSALLARWPGHVTLDQVDHLPALYQVKVTSSALIGTATGYPRARFDPVTLKPLP